MMEDGKCAIWGTPATYEPTNSRAFICLSARAGGKYLIPFPINRIFSSQDLTFKLKLTSWLIEQRNSGNDLPLINEKIANNEIGERNLLNTSQRINNYLLYCLRKKIRIGDAVVQIHPNTSAISDPEILAWTESADVRDFIKFMKFLSRAGYLDDGLLTLNAYQQIESLEQKNSHSKKAFVAMWFDSSVNAAYENAIVPAIRDAGFEPIRIDRKEHNNKIDDEIIAELRRSRFVIADFTSATHERDGKREAISRGGVYYEAGFAHGMGIPVIWTCHEDVIDLVHFDTRQYNHIVWKDADDLRVKLYNRIRATIT